MEKKEKIPAQVIFILLCVGYFLAYIPYTYITKMASRGLYEGMNGAGIANWSMQPIMIFASFTMMYLTITVFRWWKYAQHRNFFGISIPWPHWFTFISGICTAFQIFTTTLAYTYKESIVFVMLLMRGGVLVLAPLVDILVNTIRKKLKKDIPPRKIAWYSALGLLFSLGAVIVAFLGEASSVITTACLINAGVYIFVYFWRFFFMDTFAKTEDDDLKKRFFVEEQATANIVLFFGLLAIGIVGIFIPGPKNIFKETWIGFTQIPFSGYFWDLILAGVCSYGTGLFGSLIYLDKRALTFCVPANRISSIFAGTLATYLLFVYQQQRQVTPFEIGGVGLVFIAILFLAWPGILKLYKKIKTKLTKESISSPA